jgi:hypothetical protein
VRRKIFDELSSKNYQLGIVQVDNLTDTRPTLKPQKRNYPPLKRETSLPSYIRSQDQQEIFTTNTSRSDLPTSKYSRLTNDLQLISSECFNNTLLFILRILLECFVIYYDYFDGKCEVFVLLLSSSDKIFWVHRKTSNSKFVHSDFAFFIA